MCGNAMFCKKFKEILEDKVLLKDLYDEKILIINSVIRFVDQTRMTLFQIGSVHLTKYLILIAQQHLS